MGRTGRDIETFLLERGTTGELSLCCGCLESVLSVMGPFGGFFRDIPSPVSGDVLPLVSLVWLPHTLLTQSLESPLVHLYSCLLSSIAVQEVALVGQSVI